MRCTGLLLVLLLSGLFGCAIQPLSIQGIRGIKITSDQGHIRFSGLVSAYNPNKHRLSWKSYDLDLTVQDAVIGHSESQERFRIMPQDSVTIPLEIQTSASTLGLAVIPILSTWLNGAPLTVGVKGNARIRYGCIGGRLKINHTQQVYSSK